MPLPIPQLDDRTFDQLVDEARARIPRYTPEWTNLNDSDPGMTLVKLHAWLTETILYRLNKLPELNYLKFLELLNIQPRPAVAATSQLTFKLKKLGKPTDPLLVLIPKGTQVGVDDPDLQEELIFETDRTLTALNAAIAVIIAPEKTNPPRRLVTQFDIDTGEAKIALPFFPFGATSAVDAVCLVGILLRPFRQKKDVDDSQDRFPACELDVTVLVPEAFDTDAQGQTLTGPPALECLFPWEVRTEARSIVWEAYRGTQPDSDFSAISDPPSDADPWRPLSVLDETAGLSRSGHVILAVPGGLPSVSFSRLSRTFWADLGLAKPPSSAQELAADIAGDGVIPLAAGQVDKEVWETMGITGDAQTTFCELIQSTTVTAQQIVDFFAASGLTPNLAAVAASVWTEAGYSTAPVALGLTWFRARLVRIPDKPPQVSRLLLNTVPATAAVTRTEEVLGNSNGRPGQQFTLQRKPILVLPEATTGRLDAQIELSVTELNQSETWRSTDDFFGIGPDEAVFRLDAAASVVTFGDSVHGRIPVAGAEITAVRYRHGGGQVGNAGSGTVKTLRSVLPYVDSVTNVRAASGGANAEPLSEVLIRAPHELRTRDRAVTQDDFAELARQTPGVPIQRAYALAGYRVSTTTGKPQLVGGTPGAVTVVVLPQNKEDTPLPSEEQLRRVCEFLSSRRLITTELYVSGPHYVAVDQIAAQLWINRDMDRKAVQDAASQRLRSYFHPLRGGDDGRGWPFGQSIRFAPVYRLLLNVAGVRRVECLSMSLAAADLPANVTVSDQNLCADVLPVPEGALISVPEGAIKLEVRYDTNR